LQGLGCCLCCLGTGCFRFCQDLSPIRKLRTTYQLTALSIAQLFVRTQTANNKLCSTTNKALDVAFFGGSSATGITNMRIKERQFLPVFCYFYLSQEFATSKLSETCVRLLDCKVILWIVGRPV
jgi:hypothetical protein